MMKKIMISILLATSLYYSESYGQVSIGRASPANSTAPSQSFSRGTEVLVNNQEPVLKVENDYAPAATATPHSNLTGNSRQVSGQANPDEIIDPVPATLKVFKTWEEMVAFLKANEMKLERKIDEQE